MDDALRWKINRSLQSLKGRALSAPPPSPHLLGGGKRGGVMGGAAHYFFYCLLYPPFSPLTVRGEKKGGQKISIAALESALMIHTKWGGLIKKKLKLKAEG
jgi:hypothetical protein